MTKTLKAAKIDYTEFFAHKSRANGYSLVYLTDNAPIELNKFIRDIHEHDFLGSVPNDCIYKEIYWAFMALKDDKIENINIEADIYHHELIAWLDNSFAIQFYDWAVERMCKRNPYLIETLQVAQQEAKRLIYWNVHHFVEQMND